MKAANYNPLDRGLIATESCVTALYLGMRFSERPSLDLQNFAAQCGSDTHTIGAMSGAIWGAANGATKLADDLIQKLKESDRILRVSQKLHAAAVRRND